MPAIVALLASRKELEVLLPCLPLSWVKKSRNLCNGQQFGRNASVPFICFRYLCTRTSPSRLLSSPMKPLLKGYSKASVPCIMVGCLIALSIGIFGPQHMALRFRSPDTPRHLCREIGRHMTVDLTEGGQVAVTESVFTEPLSERPLVTLAVAAFIAPTAHALAAPPLVLPFTTRRILPSRRADDPDPLL